MLRKTAQSVLVHRNRINYLTRRSAVTILKLSDIFVDETLTKNKKQQQQKSDVPEKYNDKIKSFDVDCFKNGDHSWEESLSIPTNDVIGTDIVDLCQIKSIDAIMEAETLFRAYVKSYDASNGKPSLNSHHFDLVFSALVKAGNLQHAQNFLEWMDNINQAKKYPLIPSVPCFQALISSYTKDVCDPNKAERIFMRLLELVKSNLLNIGSSAFTQSANSIIHAFAKEGQPEKAFEMLLFIDRADRVQLDSFSFNAVMSGYLRKGEPQKCLQVLELMEEMLERGYSELKPTTVSYNSVMQSLIESSSNSNETVHRVEEIFSRMLKMSRDNNGVKPDSRTYNILMNAYAAVGGIDAAAKTEKLLQHMEKNYQAGDQSLKPDTVSFNTVIKSWASVGSSIAATNAEAILDTMEELSRNGDIDSTPDHISYNNCIHAWSLCGNAVAAEKILKRMKNPNTVSYNSVLSAWIRAGSTEAAAQVLRLVHEMEKQAANGNGDVFPDEITYHQCTRAVVQHNYDFDSIQKANSFLKQMEQILSAKNTKPVLERYGTLLHACTKSGDSNVAYIADDVIWRMNDKCSYNKPRIVLNNFNMAISVWLRSSESSSLIRIKKLLDRLVEIHRNENVDVFPDIYSFNCVIDAAARTKGDNNDKSKAMKIAQETFELLKEFKGKKVEPNSYTFDALIKCAVTLIPQSNISKRRAVVAALFKSCCNAGYLDRTVFSRIQKYTPELSDMLYGKYIRKSNTTRLNVYNDFPDKWSRFVPTVEKNRART